MNEEELNRMRNYAEAAREHPTWSVAYAQDVPKLLDEVDELQEKCCMRETRERYGTGKWKMLWDRLRFAEMVLDRNAVTFDGLPWREAARLREAADGIDEPETGAKADA